MDNPIVQSFCTGSFFGVPLILWGILLLRDRDRTWEVQRRRNEARGIIRKRTPAWDRRQILYGSLMIFAGAMLIIGLTVFSVVILMMADLA